MLMKPSVPRSNRKVVSPAAARNAALVNQFATPGLGSLMAGRWMAGTGQLLLAVAGFVFVVLWFFKTMIQFSDEIDGNATPPSAAWLGETGAALFILAWLWSLVTSIGLMMRAKAEAPAGPPTVPPPMAKPPAEPPILSE